MSEIRNLIKETNKSTRKARMINNVLWVIVVALVGVSIYTTMLSITLKDQAEIDRDAKKEALVISDSLVQELEITKENLEGEKAKLEEIQVSYDSLRQVVLVEQGDELWDYAVEQNTVQGYGDYIKIKGATDEAVDKLKALLNRRGYVQVQESNGNVLIKSKGYGIWVAKSARSIRYGVMGLKEYRNTNRNGDVILEGQPFIILQDSLMSGRTRWAKIAY